MDFYRKTIILLIFSSFICVSWGQDNNSPELSYFSFSPDTVNVYDRNPVVFIFAGIDDFSGFDGIEIGIRTENYSYNKWTSNWDYSGETQIMDSLKKPCSIPK